MIRVHFDPTKLSGKDKQWWERWSRRAETAKLAAIEQVKSDVSRGEPTPEPKLDFKSNVWTALKEFLLKKVFHGKCAYCESWATVTGFGDAEHYRPKGKVTVRHPALDIKGKQRTVQSSGRDHGGYYWLAYDWRNLLPACSQCNGGEGKMNQFPVRKSHASDSASDLEPDALDDLEEPLLLHPYKDEPRDHLVFGHDGIVTAKPGSDRGHHSIRVYHLDRLDLMRARDFCQGAAWREYLAAAAHGGPDDARDVLKRLEGGRDQYSAAALDYVELMIGLLPRPTR